MISQLIKVAKDTSRVYDERFAALGTLGHFLDSSRNVECFNGDRSERGYYIALTTGFDRPERTGAQRLTSEDKALIRDFMLAFINTTGNMELISIAQIFLRGYH